MSLVLQADFVVCLKTSQFFLKKSHHNGRSKKLNKNLCSRIMIINRQQDF